MILQPFYTHPHLFIHVFRSCTRGAATPPAPWHHPSTAQHSSLHRSVPRDARLGSVGHCQQPFPTAGLAQWGRLRLVQHSPDCRQWSLRHGCHEETWGCAPSSSSSSKHTQGGCGGVLQADPRCCSRKVGAHPAPGHWKLCPHHLFGEGVPRRVQLCRPCSPTGATGAWGLNSQGSQVGLMWRHGSNGMLLAHAWGWEGTSITSSRC